MSAPDALAGERWRRADGTFIDPVCGMTVRPDGPHACVHGGVEFRFCNPRCRERFIADPQHWLAPQPDADAAIAGDPAPPGTAWVCPMCPEVHESAPGPCPRCGMALEPELPGADDAAAAAGQADFRRRLWLAVPATVATMVLGMAMALPWLQALLATPVVLWSGWPLLERARASVRNRSVNMFTLIGLGVGLAWGWSLLVVLWPGAIAAPLRVLHFEAATGIVTLVLVGQLLEMRARASAGSALRALLALTPPVVHRLDAEGQVEDVDVAAVRPGDRLRVRPGEAFAVDGVVLDGDSAVDQSLLTGESAPLPCGPGDAVHAGCVNGAGPLVVEARGSGDHTVLARIIRQVAAAQRSRAPVQALVDRVAAVFVPAVIGIAGLAAVVWFAVGPAPAFAHALQVAITVLIVACPCALGLATPMAVLVASGRGARAGVLFRDAGAIERMAQVDTVLVDKTGTLTVGRPELADLWIDPASGLDDAAVLGLALALEQASEHPLARAVVDAARARGLAAAAVGALAVTPGRGIAGDVGGRRVALGNPQWVVDGAADAPDALVAELARSVREGGTAVLLAVDGRVVALFALVDAVRPGAAEWVTELREAGIDVRMATGDAVEAARRVAAQVGIADLRASLTPDAKLAWVRELQAAGRVVAMAGDGINDAPALAAADVGVAMGSGTDVAMQTAAVTLVGGDLGALLRARRLSAAARRVIRQNLLLAFGYNLVAVPVAAGVLYPLTGTLVAPMLAAAAMSASSLAVIGNALRLRGVWLG